VLCDCETGYVLDFIVYTGAQTEMESIPELRVSGGIAATLMKSFFNKGHSPYTDNYYRSPTLSDYLFSRKTNSCGTEQKMCAGFSEKAQKRSESLGSQKMLALKWRDHGSNSVDRNAQRCHGNTEQGQKDSRVCEEATVCFRLQ
jgi:hypothetical protein